MKRFWTVKFYMKNGDVIQGTYVGPEASSGDVATKVLSGNDGTFNGIDDNSGQYVYQRTIKFRPFCGRRLQGDGNQKENTI